RGDALRLLEVGDDPILDPLPGEREVREEDQREEEEGPVADPGADGAEALLEHLEARIADAIGGRLDVRRLLRSLRGGTARISRLRVRARPGMLVTTG